MGYFVYWAGLDSFAENAGWMGLDWSENFQAGNGSNPWFQFRLDLQPTTTGSSRMSCARQPQGGHFPMRRDLLALHDKDHVGGVLLI